MKKRCYQIVHYQRATSEHKLILDALRESKDCIGITFKTRNSGMDLMI